MSYFFNIEDYNSPLPPFSYPDANYLYEMYGNNPENKFADACYDYTNRLAANDCIMAVSSITLEELEHVIIKGIYKKYGMQKYPEERWDKLKKETDCYMGEANDEIDRVTEELLNNKIVIDIPVNMDLGFTRMRQAVIRKYSLDSKDASHIVAAYQNKINCILTVDIDFSTVSNFNIFTPNAKYFLNNTSQNTLLSLPERLIE